MGGDCELFQVLISSWLGSFEKFLERWDEKLHVSVSIKRLNGAISQKFLTIYLIVCFLTIFSVTTFSFFYHFDVTDEGFYLYLFSHGSEAKIEATRWGDVFHYVGKLFNHSVLGYRFLALFSYIGAASFALYQSYVFIKKQNQSFF